MSLQQWQAQSPQEAQLRPQLSVHPGVMDTYVSLSVSNVHL